MKMPATGVTELDPRKLQEGFANNQTEGDKVTDSDRQPVMKQDRCHMTKCKGHVTK